MDKKEVIFVILRDIICDLFLLESDEVKLESDIHTDLGFDDLDLVEFVIALEKEFTIHIPDRDLDEIGTDIKSFVDYLLGVVEPHKFSKYGEKVKEIKKPEDVERPLIGVKPRYIAERDYKIARLNEISNVIKTFYEKGLPLQIEWIEEYNELIEFVKNCK